MVMPFNFWFYSEEKKAFAITKQKANELSLGLRLTDFQQLNKIPDRVDL